MLRKCIFKLMYSYQLLTNSIRSFSLVHGSVIGQIIGDFTERNLAHSNVFRCAFFGHFRVNFFAKSFRNVFSSHPPFLILNPFGGLQGGNPSYLATTTLSH